MTSTIVHQGLYRIMIAALVLVAVFTTTNAASAVVLSSVRDTMTRQKALVDSKHTFNFNLPASVYLGLNDVFTFDMDDGDAGDAFTLDAAGSWTAATDLAFTRSNSGSQVYTPLSTITTNGTPDCTGATGYQVGLSIVTGTSTIVVQVCSQTAASSSGTDALTIVFGANGDRIANPSATSSPSDPTEINVAFTDNSTAANNTNTNVGVPIVADDQVTVSGTVESMLTAGLSALTTNNGFDATTSPDSCTLGIIPIESTGTVADCGYKYTVTTNASSGYLTSIYEASTGLARALNTTDNIDDVSPATATGSVQGSTEEWGVASAAPSAGTLSSEFASITNSNCSTAALTSSASAQNAIAMVGTAATTQNWWSKSSPSAASGDSAPLCIFAAASITTVPGDYSNTLTHIATGTF